jgi:hypothetical protein
MLKTDDLREVTRCARSFGYFLSRHVWMRTAGGTKFRPWSWQAELAQALPCMRRAQFLKARQLGMSWLFGAYALHTALFEPGADVLLTSQTEDDAIELLSKVRFIFQHLPDYLKPVVGRDNTEVLEFSRLFSAIHALPSSEKAGRGFTGRLVIADEHAHHQWAEANMAAVDPTIDAGGQFLSLSSANGVGNLFADLWAKATSNRREVIPRHDEERGWTFGGQLLPAVENTPEGAWLPVFLPYGVRPGREGDWWDRKQANTTPAWLIFQEYPRDAEEAFVQTGRPVFRKDYLDTHKAAMRDPLPREQWPALFADWRDDELRVFELPQPGHRYVAGADVAEGLEHGDYSDLTVFDVNHPSRKPTEVLTLHGHWEPDVFGMMLDKVARIYRGTYGIERNNHGLTVVVTCRNLGTMGLYAERPVLNKQGQEIEPGKLGWLTTQVTKPLMIDALEEALRTFGIRLSDIQAHRELVYYQTLKDGKTGAPSGQWDDRVMSRAIAVQMLNNLPRDARPAVGGQRPVITQYQQIRGR